MNEEKFINFGKANYLYFVDQIYKSRIEKDYKRADFIRSWLLYNGFSEQDITNTHLYKRLPASYGWGIWANFGTMEFVVECNSGNLDLVKSAGFTDKEIKLADVI